MGGCEGEYPQGRYCPGLTARADLYIFPEMFSTGFCTFPEGIAETEGQTLQWMKTKSAQIGAAIAGSVAIRDDGLV